MLKVREVLEQHRIIAGDYASRPHDQFGAFRLMGPCGKTLVILATDGADTGWEHVSVSVAGRNPNWQEMCFVKDLFWPPEDCVVQYHPPRSEYVNMHPHCLHLWRMRAYTFPKPPSILVGCKTHAKAEAENA